MGISHLKLKRQLKILAFPLAFGLLGSVHAGTAQNPVILEVAGQPIDASATEQDFLYEIPAKAEGDDDGGGSAQSWAMLGREDLSAKTGSDEFRVANCEAERGAVFGWENVVDEIATQAATRRVVIINESHATSRHRETTRMLLHKLRPFGFTVFAAETFTNDKSNIPIVNHAALKWPSVRDGYYSREPVFGRLIRDAKGLGYRLAAYEEIYDPNAQTIDDADKRIEAREADQAQHLADLLKTMGSQERLLVHVGYSHAAETPIKRRSGQDALWMAARLKALTGIDPLTIAQTECRTNKGKPFIASPLTDDRKGWFDYVISHPVEKFVRHRPLWRRQRGDVEVKIPKELRPTNEPLVIEAFAEGEPFDAIPMDRIFVAEGEDVPLLLPPGRYNVRAVRTMKK